MAKSTPLSKQVKQLRMLQSGLKKTQKTKRSSTPDQHLWLVVHRDTDMLKSLEDFEPATPTGKAVNLPESEHRRLQLINSGKIVLFDGALKLFIIPEEVSIKGAEQILNKLFRRHGDCLEEVYLTASRMIFGEHKDWTIWNRSYS